MGKQFFITGLPRSRTLWFSEYFTNPISNIYCFHEAMNGCMSVPSYKNTMNMGAKMSVGDASSILPYSDFQDWYPHAPTVIIERDIDEVNQSLKLCIDPNHDFRGQLFNMQKYLSTLHGLRVRYEEINDRLEEIHQYLNIPFYQSRAEHYIDINIQLQNFTVDIPSWRFWVGVENTHLTP